MTRSTGSATSRSPAIPLAGESGLELALGRMMPDAAYATFARRAEMPAVARLSFAANASAPVPPLRFLYPDFVAQLLAALMQSGANPHRLKLELTLIAKAWKRRRNTTSPASHGCPAYQDCLPGKPLPQSGAYCAIQGMPGPHFA